MAKRIIIAWNTTPAKTVRYMKKEIRKAANRPDIQKLANSFLKYPIPEKAIFDFAYNRMAFLEDEENHQDIAPINVSLRDGVGNCVDYTVFIGSLLYALGIPFKMKVVEVEKGEGYGHIYIVTDKYILDPTLGQPLDGSARYARPQQGQFNKEGFFLPLNYLICQY